MKLYPFLFFVFITVCGYGQGEATTHIKKKLAISDTVIVDSVAINPSKFRILNTKGILIDSVDYKVDYSKGTVLLSERIKKQNDSIIVEYVRYPDFLTRDYFAIDPKVIVKNNGSIDKLYSLQKAKDQKKFTPFEGLNTLGSITRGVTIGNNQNAVVNSELDLQITGKLSEKVSIRASIQDANIPTQEGGYSQSLNEFDQIFIELFSDNWNIRAGDVDLRNEDSYFGQFTKKVQGISLRGTLDHGDGASTSAFASGAIVRGVFSSSKFTGQDGNQGPYKLVGPNGELFILIVSGSERVYVNGLLLDRGENNDYVIDYNAGEIKFNPTYPITSNMRITVEYQFTDRNYTRFIGYGGGDYTSKTLDIGAYVYTESDAKNQPLQQNLSQDQVTVLQNAGDDISQMTAPSAVADSFSENKILYRKELIDEVEAFVFSTNPEDELFSVRFSFVGENSGDYILSSTDAISRIFEFAPPVNGVAQGNYAPIIQLKSPESIQVGGLKGVYHPSEKTNIAFEVAGSKNDLNLFSNIDDKDNEGFAGRVQVRQTLLQSSDSLRVLGFATADIINKNFRSVERIYNVEFNRDWNLENPTGNQRFISAGLRLEDNGLGTINYELQNLDFSENFSGLRQVLTSNLRFGCLKVNTSASYLQSDGNLLKSDFLRINNTTKYSFKKAWVGVKFRKEDNEVRAIANDSLTPVSQKFDVYETFVGIGDSTKVFVEAGYQYRVNDSVQGSSLSRVSTANSIYLNSKFIQSANAQLSLYANYREVKNEAITNSESNVRDQFFNSRLLYNQSLFNGGIRWNTAVETSNGVVPQQEFTFTQVEPGQGVYTWNDYNENGVQELEEFEIAQFQDEASYVRILLPNQRFVKIRQNKFSQILTLHPQKWSSELGFKKFLSKFYNQTSYVLDRKIARDGDDFSINPFEDGGDNELGLNLNFRNVLFFNRGKQHYTTSYTYLSSSNRNLLSVGLLKNKLASHQFNFNHKVWESWLFSLKGSIGSNESASENFANRNFDLDIYDMNPKISYLLSAQTRFDIFYQFLNKENTLGGLEQLDQQKIGFSFSFADAEKISINGEFNYIDNTFTGNAFSPVAYQILEGLQPGTNFTWRLLFQKKITKYLDANLSYFGRKSKSTSTIHTGSIQLRAYF